MIGKPLAVLALRAEAVALPRFAQLAPGAAIARTASLMMHEVQPFSPPAAGEATEIGVAVGRGKIAKTCFQLLHLSARGQHVMKIQLICIFLRDCFWKSSVK